MPTAVRQPPPVVAGRARARPGTLPPAGPAPRLPPMPGIDGLRAIAVAAVLLYHADLRWLPGGFLGVDVFLVISGYLITSLLLDERRRTGRLHLGRFWLRRARRLLPAVVVLVAACLVAGAVAMPDQLARLRGDALAALAYVMNWHLVLSQVSYFESFGRPPLLQHLWSLAVEEQFYLAWPVAFAAGMALLGRRRLVAAVGLAAVGSAVLMAVLYVPGEDPSRVYYGTDTRAVGLLAGVLLAFAWAPGRLRARTGRGAGRVLDAAGLLGLVALAAAFARVHDFDPGLYRGGFALVAVAAAVVVAVLAHPAARLGRALGAAPLRWVGARSYGIYLWHWPVLVLTGPAPGRPGAGPLVVAAQVALVVALAAASYRWVEQPIRAGGLRAVRDAVAGLGPRVRAGAVVGGAAAALAVAWALLAPAPPAAPRVAPAVATAEARLPVASPAPAPAPGPAPAPARSRRAALGPVLAVGDSVMLRAAPGLERGLGRRLRVDAAVARAPATIVARLQAYRAARALPDRVVVQVGNNGPVLGRDVRGLRAALAGVPHVVLVTVRVPRSWEDEANEAVRRFAATRPGAVVADWEAATAGRPDLLEDGTHPTPPGVRLYARTVARALERTREG